MIASLKSMGRILMVLTGLLIGVGLIVLFVTNRQMPIHDDTTPELPVLSVIEVQLLAFRLEARGYGVALPSETWQAIANVGGRVVERHTDLESGSFLPEGTLLLALDPNRYQLSIAEAEAELDSLTAERAQLMAEKANTQFLIELERERLALAEQELLRFEDLFDRGVVSRSQLDGQRRAMLSQRYAVESLKSQQRLIPSRLQRLDAQANRVRTRLEQAQQDLEDTRFIAPYDLRIWDVEVEMHQHVATGQRLFRADNIEAAEVEARIPLTMLRRVIEAIAQPEHQKSVPDISKWLDFSSIRTEVFLPGVKDVEWAGRVTRIASGLDPDTRTARVVVIIDEPYREAYPSVRPALQREMFVHVRLSVEYPEPLLVIPSSAVHQGEVYLVDAHHRLERRKVEVAFEQRELAVISKGLAQGDLVIVDDPVPAISGMELVPRLSDDLSFRLQRMAAGEEP